ncbi:5'-methylthioadenosine/adenosylhomocysteine nucleosidase [Lapidilactobacillus mulanensis]|uniref:5'-methylthioadenosine/S-adenosylhomocysteine nucleosidase n=2 Tax=Lactobacillaceae TaxID=33958 RepID=A0ABW4DIP7_9LACO|nr:MULTISPECIES: 5'-methylthioadenosine/adenosylhomocysteine nucleosidase [Lactobacillaceae]
MKIGIIGAMNEEVKILKNKMINTESKMIANSDFCIGYIDGVEIILVQSGIGKVQAAIAATILSEKYHPDMIINTGSAGVIGKNLTIGDIVISKELAYHDVDATAFGYAYGQLPQQVKRFSANKKLIAQVEKAANKFSLKTRVGLIVSGDQFIASEKQKYNILKHFPDALASEMEGTAIAQVALQFEIPFVVIRAMSDVGDEKAGVSFDDFIIEAGKRSALMVIQLIQEVSDKQLTN